MKVSRRRLMVGGAAVATLGVGVGVYGATATAFDYFKVMLREYLPGVPLPDELVRQFSDEAVLGRNPDFAPKLYALSAAVRVAGFHAVATAMRDNFDFEKFNRDLLTFFLTRSNFFDLPDPRNGVIEFYGHSDGCANRFAQFERPT